MRADIGQMEFIDPQLRKMALWIEEKTGFKFTLTSIYRPGDEGVHGTKPVRGVDLRCRSSEIGIAIEAYINKFWIYDHERPGKKCCYLHGDGSNLHLHLQVHPNTKYIGS